MKGIVFLKMFAVVLATAMLTSCATIFTGTKDRITFNSEPPGAMVYIDGVEQGVTPLTMKVKRTLGDKDVEFKLDGYETRLITLDKSFNVVSVINLTNLLGWGVDALTGSVMKYDRKAYDIKLKGQTTSSINPTDIKIDHKNNIVELYVMEDNF